MTNFIDEPSLVQAEDGISQRGERLHTEQRVDVHYAYLAKRNKELG